MRRAMSSLFSKYPSLLFEIFSNDAEQNLHSGQLHHLPTSNGKEITTLLFTVIHSSRGILNPFRGIYIQPFGGIMQPFRRITCTSMQSTACQRTTQSIPPQLHESELKQKCLVSKIMPHSSLLLGHGARKPQI